MNDLKLDNAILKLVFCKECRTVKATAANVLGDTGWCQTCGKTTQFAILIPEGKNYKQA